MKAKTKARVQSALWRAARTFLQTAIAVLIASGTGFVDVSTLKAAALAGGAAVLALIQRALDTTDLPTLPPG